MARLISTAKLQMPIFSMQVKCKDILNQNRYFDISSVELKLEYPDNHFDIMSESEFFELTKKYIKRIHNLDATLIVNVKRKA